MQEPKSPDMRENILIKNIEIFNGKDEKTFVGNVLIVGNLISKVSASPIAIPESLTVKEINGEGKFLMPGLIDNHVHLAMNVTSYQDLIKAEMTNEKLDELMRVEGREMLLRGFTTVRDEGGPVFTVKKDFDNGTFPGPRIFPSGAMISQTSGHGDMRMPDEKSRRWGGGVSKGESLGLSFIADGVPEVLTAARENLRSGASQVKVMAGGGAGSVYDPLDVTQYTFDEIKAAVNAAEDWGTYVTVHAYTSRAVRRCIEAGVKCIEHGHLLDSETIKMLADHGAYLSLQVFDEAPLTVPQFNREKLHTVIMGTDNVFKWAIQHKVKLLWGNDLIFVPQNSFKQSTAILKLQAWFSNYEILKLITFNNAQIFELSGLRSPYRAGKLGEISEGAYADLIIIDGNPLKDLKVMTEYERKFKVIIKDGVVIKNTIDVG
jgi:imidazolonepropionase-like amidohydrolase